MAYEITRPIQHKRGLKADLPTLAVGEFGFCTDTKELYIGSADGNVPVNVSLLGTDNEFSGSNKFNQSSSEVINYNFFQEQIPSFSLSSSITIDGTTYEDLSDIFVVTSEVVDGITVYTFTATSAWDNDPYGFPEIYVSFSPGADVSLPTVKIMLGNYIGLDDFYLDGSTGDSSYSRPDEDIEIVLSNVTFLDSMVLVPEYDDNGYFTFYSPIVAGELAKDFAEFGDIGVKNTEDSLVISKGNVPKATSGAVIFTNEILDGFQDYDDRHIFGNYDFERDGKQGYILIGLKSGELANQPSDRFRYDYVFGGYSDAADNDLIFQQALDEQILTGKPIKFCAGAFYISTAPVTVWGSIEGHGRDKSILNILNTKGYNEASGKFTFKGLHSHLKNINVYHNVGYTTESLFYIFTDYFTIENVYVYANNIVNYMIYCNKNDLIIRNNIIKAVNDIPVIKLSAADRCVISGNTILEGETQIEIIRGCDELVIINNIMLGDSAYTNYIIDARVVSDGTANKYCNISGNVMRDWIVSGIEGEFFLSVINSNMLRKTTYPADTYSIRLLDIGYGGSNIVTVNNISGKDVVDERGDSLTTGNKYQ